MLSAITQSVVATVQTLTSSPRQTQEAAATSFIRLIKKSLRLRSRPWWLTIFRLALYLLLRPLINSVFVTSAT